MTPKKSYARYLVAPNRKPDEADEIIFQHKQYSARPPVALYRCGRCREAKSLEQFSSGAQFLPDSRRTCIDCACRPLPAARPLPSVEPRRTTNRAAEIARRRVEYDDNEHYEAHLRYLEANPERFGLVGGGECDEAPNESVEEA